MSSTASPTLKKTGSLALSLPSSLIRNSIGGIISLLKYSKDTKETSIDYGHWNDLLSKKLSSMYRKYKRFLGKYQAYMSNPKDSLDSKWSDDLMAEVIGYSPERPTKRFIYFDYSELTAEMLQHAKFFEQFGGKNPVCPEQTGVLAAEHAEAEQNLHFKKFHELNCTERLHILYHFCLIRALQGNKEQPQVTPAVQPAASETAAVVKPKKRVAPIGLDRNRNEYYHFEDHKDGRLYKLVAKSKRYLDENITECFIPIENVKKLMESLEKSKDGEELQLKKALDERLKTMEEDDKETQLREQTRIRKLQSLTRSKRMLTNAKKQYADAYNTEVPYINLISNAVMTRAQLQSLKNKLIKPQTTEDIMKEKYERQKLERQKRLERRQHVSVSARLETLREEAVQQARVDEWVRRVGVLWRSVEEEYVLGYV
eukprot:TRINITY_DN15566_c0_g1_i5.p1 TRINITY_DN15566_c0_g1~~TRINITY_DN15566_c0_g1_i5.p1  ORF type:complete len:428 (+),score=119.16 TRINITY_DN15566_c0_g1_i5:297-1580(+)